MNKQTSNKNKREDIESRKFWLAIEELTLFLKENHNEIVNAVKRSNYKENKEIFRLEIENLNYRINELM